MKRGLLLLSAVACASPRWEHDVVVEIRSQAAPAGAVAAAERAVWTYADALSPYGLAVATGAPGDIVVEWDGRAGAEHPHALGFTHMTWGVDGSLDRAVVHLRTDLDWSSTESCGTGFDVEAALVHELGHAFGLWHSPEPSAVMHVPVPACPEAALKRRLAADDLDELFARYGP